MRYLVLIEEGPTSYGAFAPDLPGCISVGETEAEAKELIQEAIRLHLNDLCLCGKPRPKPVSKCTFVKVRLPKVDVEGKDKISPI